MFELVLKSFFLEFIYSSIDWSNVYLIFIFMIMGYWFMHFPRQWLIDQDKCTEIDVHRTVVIAAVLVIHMLGPIIWIIIIWISSYSYLDGFGNLSGMNKLLLVLCVFGSRPSSKFFLIKVNDPHFWAKRKRKEEKN